MSRAEFWSAHLAAIESSAMTTKAYANQHELSVSALYSWRKKFKQAKANEKGVIEPARFMAVQVTSAEHATMNASRCTVILASGLRVELEQLPPADWLLCLSRALRDPF